MEYPLGESAGHASIEKSADHITRGRKLVAFAIAAVMIVSALAFISSGSVRSPPVPNADDSVVVDAGGGSRSVTYGISHIGESYRKSADYRDLGRHIEPGLSQWWDTRNNYYNETTVHDSYPYVVTYFRGSGIIHPWDPPYPAWATCSFYRLTVDARNISGLATGANKDPWIVPIMGDQATDGGWVNMSLFASYLTNQEFADIKADKHYANTLYGVNGTEYESVWHGQASDGWLSEIQGHFDFDRNAASKFLGLSSGGSLIDQFNSVGANNIAAEWAQEWIDDGDMFCPLDIYAAYSYSLMAGNGPVFVKVKLDEANSSTDRLALWFWSQTWGAEILMVRYLETVGIYKHWESDMEDWYLNGTLGPVDGDIHSRQTSVFHLTAWKDTDPGAYMSPAWLLEPQHIDYLPDRLEDAWVSQYDPYAWTYYGPDYKPTRICWIPGQAKYGSEAAYWQTPRTWNLTTNETLTIRLPVERQGWGIEPYFSNNYTLPGNAVGEMNSNAITGEWVLGHGWPHQLYSTTFYDPDTKTITIPGGTSWTPKMNHNPAYKGLFEQGTPTFMLDISRVSHYRLTVPDPEPYVPGRTYTLQVTPLNLTMQEVRCNQTVVLPAVPKVSYGENAHTFLWNESSWNTTVVFEGDGPYYLVSHDQYFYLDIEDTYVIGDPPLEFTLMLARGWNLVSIPPTMPGFNASTLGLRNSDVVAGWNPETKTYDKYYIVGSSPPTLDFTIMNSTGYWIYASAWENVTIIGSCPTTIQSRSITVPASGGWAIIGLNSLMTTLKASDVPGMYSGGDVKLVAGYDPVTKSYRTYVKGLPPSDFYLLPWHAYWIYVTGSGTLTYSPILNGNIAPAAAFTYYCTLLSSMYVNGSTSYDPDGTIAGYSWNWGDGSPETAVSTSPFASHGYYPGTYDVSLTVYDDLGLDDTTTQKITVYGDIPYIIFGYVRASDGVTIVPNCNITITDMTTGKSMTTLTDIDNGFYSIDSAVLPLGARLGDVINVTAYNGTAIGFAEGVVMSPGNEAYLWLDIRMSDLSGGARREMVPSLPTMSP